MPKASSCMFVLPRMTAPASSSFCTVGAFAAGLKSRRPGVPAVFGKPATWMLSFTASGTLGGGQRARAIERDERVEVAVGVGALEIEIGELGAGEGLGPDEPGGVGDAE